jgi:hypothetical protein
MDIARRPGNQMSYERLLGREIWLRPNVPGPHVGASSALTTAALTASKTHEYAQTGITIRYEYALLSA